MKKFISTITILLIVCSANSCRSQEENLDSAMYTNTQTGDIFKKTGDSLETDSLKAVPSPLPTDPPPKNGHQW